MSRILLLVFACLVLQCVSSWTLFGRNEEHDSELERKIKQREGAELAPAELKPAPSNAAALDSGLLNPAQKEETVPANAEGYAHKHKGKKHKKGKKKPGKHHGKHGKHHKKGKKKPHHHKEAEDEPNHPKVN